MTLDERVKVLRESQAAYPHGLHTDEGCLYVEHDQVGIIRHENDWFTSADVRLATLIVRCSHHMLAILDALAAKDREIERLRGALVSVEIKTLGEPGVLMNSVYRIAHAALNPSKEGGSDA